LCSEMIAERSYHEKLIEIIYTIIDNNKGLAGLWRFNQNLRRCNGIL
jgi:hypothetical protein